MSSYKAQHNNRGAVLCPVCCSSPGGLERTAEFELNAVLQDAVAAGGKAGQLRITAHILPEPPQAAGPGGSVGGGGGGAVGAAGAVQPRVQQLARLRLRLEPGWPLSLVVGEGMLRQYNAVLVLLLQVRGVW